jgi:lysyl-tRNA synthetase class 1
MKTEKRKDIMEINEKNIEINTTFNHWAYKLAEKIIERQKKENSNIVITSGITTSGPAHLGTIIEGLMPQTITNVLRDLGKNVDFYFIADIMDAFDSIPKDLENYKDMLEEHLGKPLAFVPDPYKDHESYGEHFLNETIEVFNAFNIKPVIKKAHELYKQNAFYEQTLLFIRNIDKVKEIIERISGRKLPKDWHAIMPICEKCGKIATTTVISADEEGNYEYICNKDIGYTKGCMYKGRGNIKEGNYKLQWRLHWPSWHLYFKTTAEGGGLDHFTKGGSWDTAKAIHEEIFNREPPIGYRWGFILEHGRKMSKSKGVILNAKELIKLIHPSVIAYHLLKYDLEENINFNPEKEELLNIIDDYESASLLLDKKDRTRAEEKKAAAFYLTKSKKQWEGNFRDYLLYYSIYRNWEKVKMHLNKDPKSVIPYIEYWFEKGYIPEDYNFSYSPKKAQGQVKEFIKSLNENMTALEIHNAVYEFCKLKHLEPKTFFAELYKTIINKDKGPRLGKLISALGVNKIKNDLLD